MVLMDKKIWALVGFVLLMVISGCTVSNSRMKYPPFDPQEPLNGDDLREIGYSNFTTSKTTSAFGLGSRPEYTTRLTINGTDNFVVKTRVYLTPFQVDGAFAELSKGMQAIDTNNGKAAQSGAKGVLADKWVVVEITGPTDEMTAKAIHVILKRTRKGIEDAGKTGPAWEKATG